MNNSSISDYICLCSKVKKNTYINYLRNNKKPLEDIFETLKVGINCSACRIELEKEYLKLQDNSFFTLSKNYKLRYFTNNLIKLFKPGKIFLKKKILKQVAPIFSGNDITTNLVISNFSIGNFSQYNVPHIVKIKIRNKIGEIVEVRKFIVNKENRLVYKLNVRNLFKNGNFDQVGAVWIEIYGTRFGYIGVTRPHIRLTTKSSISTIHMQHGRTYGVNYNTFVNKDNNHYLSLVNLENKENNFAVNFYVEGKYKFEKFYSINALSSKLINLSENIQNNKKKIINATFSIKHNGILRRNIIIRNIKNDITSIDHI